MFPPADVTLEDCTVQQQAIGLDSFDFSCRRLHSGLPTYIGFIGLYKYVYIADIYNYIELLYLDE